MGFRAIQPNNTVNLSGEDSFLDSVSLRVLLIWRGHTESSYQFISRFFIENINLFLLSCLPCNSMLINTECTLKTVAYTPRMTSQLVRAQHTIAIFCFPYFFAQINLVAASAIQLKLPWKVSGQSHHKIF